MNINGILEALRQVIAEPTANLTVALLLVAMVSLIVLILVVAMLVLISGGSRDDDDESDDEDAEDSPDESDEEIEYEHVPLSPRARVAYSVVTLLIVLAAVASGYFLTSSNEYCADYCHKAGTEAGLVESGGHADVSCRSCHEDSGAAGVAASLGTRTRYIVGGALARTPAGAASVPNRRCLACHSDDVARIYRDEKRRVRVSHTEPLAAGMTCMECHPSMGHGIASELDPGMTPCIRCHNGDKAESECGTCHDGDTSSSAALARTYGKSPMRPKAECGGCHDLRPCDACHGLRLPHSREFVTLSHAKYAAFSKKRSCLRCHSLNRDCGKCHKVPFEHHLDPWEKLHADAPRTSTCGCHQNGALAGKPFCPVCH